MRFPVRKQASSGGSRGARAKSTKPRDIEEYLETLSAPKRAALEKLRKAIRSAAPGAEECISYGIPAFRMNGRMLVAFGAAAKHCAFYPGAYPIRTHPDELRDYDTSKGTVRFGEDKPLPAALVRNLVKARVAERIAGRQQAAAGTKRRR